MVWPCYWTEDTGEAYLGLRRYSAHSEGVTCQGGYHQAFAWLDQRVPRPRVEHPLDGRLHYESAEAILGDLPHDDPRWPTVCAQCGAYEFTAEDQWQPWAEEVFRRTDTGAEVTTHPTITVPGVAQAGPGFMQDAWWFPLRLNPNRPDDGIILQVWCPWMDDRPGGQPWLVDTEATGGGYWTRTGDPRDPASLTVTPSIAIGQPSSPGYYHGFLTAGALTDHVG